MAKAPYDAVPLTPPLSPGAREGKLLTSLLKEVSRSFYLTLRVLPGSIRSQIGLAYLLARTTDTIADTELLAVDQRLDALQALQQRILGQRSDPLDFREFISRQGAPVERVLLEKCELSIAALAKLAEADRTRVREVLSIITSGQELDLQRFGHATSAQVIGLRNEAELEDYTYRVAGCVGEFWTKMCCAHVFGSADVDYPKLLTQGVRFGQGLQLVNILRDVPGDLRLGRSYLPSEALASVGLKPQDLLQPANESRLRPVYNRYLGLAEANLWAGWDYTNALPWRCARLRLACAWPILIGLDTLKLLYTLPVLAAPRPIKVTRRRVRQLLLRSLAWYPWPKAWANLAQAPLATVAGKAIASRADLP